MRVLIAALVLGLCAAGSHARVQDWRSDEALWRAAISVSETPRGLLNLAVALGARSADDEARMWTIRAMTHAEAIGATETGRRARAYLDVLSLASLAWPD